MYIFSGFSTRYYYYLQILNSCTAVLALTYGNAGDTYGCNTAAVRAHQRLQCYSASNRSCSDCTRVLIVCQRATASHDALLWPAGIVDSCQLLTLGVAILIDSWWDSITEWQEMSKVNRCSRRHILQLSIISGLMPRNLNTLQYFFSVSIRHYLFCIKGKNKVGRSHIAHQKLSFIP